MGIISKLKSIFGGGDVDRGRARDGGASVAVDREPSVESEPSAESERAVKGVPTAAGSAEEEDVADTPAAPSTEPADTTDGDPVDSIKGIGAAYAERLADAGVNTVDDLATADADDLAAETDLGAGRVGKWIERAKARRR